MIIIHDNWESLAGKSLAATIGFFDGVHLGHRFLVEELKRKAKERNLASAVITFAQHPRAVLHADYQPKLLNSFREKMAHLLELDVDYCILLDFTEELSRYSAEEFITKVLAEKCQVKMLLIGYDHRFGHNREDGFEQYVDYGRTLGMEVVQASPYNDGKTKVSSSEIRRLLLDGHVEKADELLTYPYVLQGTIVNGYKVGRTIGFPTANIAVDEPYKVLPKVGVYAVWVYIAGKRYKGMLYIGKRPTVHNGDNQTVEVHILDFSGDIYDNRIMVSFIYHIREDIKFDSLDALKGQLEKDRQEVDRRLKE